MVNEFVRKVGHDRNISDADDATGKIFTFGSYRLGVHGPGADIDTLCVVPNFVQREDFFSWFHDILKASDEVTDLTTIPDSYVPVMKLCLDGIPIDLVFARLNLPTIQNDLDLRSDELLMDLDERDVRSLNGSRVTDEILRLVPSIPVFRLALRCIKLWAKRKFICIDVSL
jgi:poly(A) polymerase